MSKHEVKVVKVENVRVHPNADSLEITDVWGYQCVVGKGKHKVGDLLAFIEPDYTVPLNKPEFAFLDKGKGKLRERITMRKFRGEPSYGLLIPAPAGSQEGDDVMSLLDVERYEPPMGGSGKGGPTGFMSGLCETGPEFPVPVYDLEAFKKYHKLFEEGEDVILTEKVHGCLHEDTLISTALGPMTISYIVENKLQVDAKSFNHTSFEVEWQPITDWMCSDSTNDTEWFLIELEDGTKIKLTGNHRVWLPELGCYREVDKLTKDVLFLLDSESQDRK